MTNKSLLAACYDNDLAAAKEAIEYGAFELNAGAIVSARIGNLDLVKFLLDHGAISCNSVMMTACEYGHVDIVNEMLARGANMYVKGFKYSCIGGNLDLVKKFLELGVGVGEVDQGFIDACGSGNMNVVEYLIDLYSDPILNPDHLGLVDPTGSLDNVFDIYTGFDYACDEGYTEVVEYLLDTYPEIQHNNIILKILEMSDYEGASSIIKLLISRSGFCITTEFDKDRFVRYFEYLSEDLMHRQRYLFLDKILNDDLIRAIKIH
jgi:ankyrin repeat protein